jgi:hypothetical protein
MRKITFHSFVMGDVDDIDIYAAQPIYEWQQTEQGRWVMEHCQDPQYIVNPDAQSWGHRVVLYGQLADQDATFFELKWGQVENR